MAGCAGGNPPRMRLVVHVDLDCFYVQVEQARRPELRGVPCAVMQYNPFGDVQDLRPDEDRLLNRSNGSLIAVGYEARACGVTRNMRAQEARKLCPELQTVQVPVRHQKADLSPYREASAKIMEIFARNAVCERASIDEAYLDVTEAAYEMRRTWTVENVKDEGMRSTNVVGLVEGAQEEMKKEAKRWWERVEDIWTESEIMLACGAAVVAKLRQDVFEELGFTCSAGISTNKLLSKLVSGMYKPNQQTLVIDSGVSLILKNLPINKLRGLGMKLGASVKEYFQIDTVGELAAIPESTLTNTFGSSTAEYLVRLSRGMDDDPVRPRQAVKQIVTGKNFRGLHSLGDIESVMKWMLELSSELVDRLEVDRAEHHRMATGLTVGIGHIFFESGSSAQSTQQWTLGLKRYITRACQLRHGGPEVIAKDATSVVKRWADQNKSKTFRITSLYLMAGGFKDLKGATSISNFFKSAPCGAQESQHAVTQNALRGAGLEYDAYEEGDMHLVKHTNPGKQQCDVRGHEGMATPSSIAEECTPSHEKTPHIHGTNAVRGETFKFYRLEEIDKSVLDELPEEVKSEVLQIMKRKEMVREHNVAPGVHQAKRKRLAVKPPKASIQTFFRR